MAGDMYTTRELLEGRLESYHPDGPQDDADPGRTVGLYGFVNVAVPYSTPVMGPQGSDHCVVAGRKSGVGRVAVAIADGDVCRRGRTRSLKEVAWSKTQRRTANSTAGPREQH